MQYFPNFNIGLVGTVTGEEVYHRLIFHDIDSRGAEITPKAKTEELNKGEVQWSGNLSYVLIY